MAGEEFAELDEQLARLDRRDPRLTSATNAASASIDDLGKWRRDQDRSFVVQMVIGLYVASLSVTILYLVIHGLCSNKSVYASISDIVKVAIVPVVTLVIGYYFGKEKS